MDKCEYLTGEDLGLKPSTVEQVKFEYSSLGKVFTKGLDKDDQTEGLFKRLKNIENTQKKLINGNNKNKPDNATDKLSLLSIFNSISSKSKDEDKDEDENEKTKCDLYQDTTEGMKGLILPGEIESKDEKYQMYLENNLNKTKINFSDIYDKYQRFFKYIANEEKNKIDCKILSIKVEGINFFYRYGTVYTYLNYFFKSSAEEISIKNASFLEDLSNVIKLKSVYTTRDINNTEKAYSDPALKNKAIDDVV